MYYLSKNIAQNIYAQLSKLDELYEHYKNQNYESGMEVVRQGRYEFLLEKYPFITYYTGLEEYITGEYFDSDKRSKIENYFLALQKAKDSNPHKTFEEIQETAENYLSSKESFNDNLHIAEAIYAENDRLEEPRVYSIFKNHFYLMMRYLVQMSKLLEAIAIEIEILDKDYVNELKKCHQFIIKIRSKLTTSLILNALKRGDIPDQTIYSFIKKNNALKILLQVKD